MIQRRSPEYIELSHLKCVGGEGVYGFILMDRRLKLLVSELAPSRSYILIPLSYQHQYEVVARCPVCL